MWSVFAEPAAEGAAAAGQVAADGAGSLLSMLITFVPMILIFYFILIRPQRKKDKEKKEMLANLKVGDKVVTIGGIVGQIARIKDDKVFVETGSNTEKQLILMERWAISTVEKLITD